MIRRNPLLEQVLNCKSLGIR